MSIEKALTWYKSKYGYLLKIFISALILSVFLLSLDLSKIENALALVSKRELVILLLLTVIRNVVGSARFRVLSSVVSKVSIYVIMKQYFVASLFNNFLPTAIGGDSVRFVMIAGEGVSKPEAGVMILLERVIGFYALVVISLASALFWSPPKQVLTVIIAMFTSYTVLMLFVISDGFGLGRKLRYKHLASIRKAFSRYRGQFGILFTVFVISLLYQYVSIYISYFVAVSIGLSISIIPFLTLTPLVWFFTMIPISFGGVGLREVSFAYLFALIGVAYEDSLLISLGTYLALVMSGFIGAVFMFGLWRKGKALP